MKNKLKRIISVVIAALMLLSVSGCSSLETQTASSVLSEGTLEDAFTESSEDGSPVANEDEDTYTITQNGYSISTSSELATMVGAAVLESGGNAVDAAIAVSYALGVLEPYASGIGGGGGMLIYDPETEEFTFLNYFSMAAPSGATSNSISVPGFVAGMETAYELYGTLDFSELLSYAIDYAENGYEVSSELAYRISAYVNYMDSSMPFYGLVEGDTLVQTELAGTLREIAEEGAEAFYSGSIAEQIVKATALTEDDLLSYETEIDEAVVSEVAGYTIASAPAPYSGLTAIQMMKLMELMDVPDPDDDAETYLDALVSIKMTTGSVRYHNICDLTYSGITLDYDELLTDSYLADLVGLEVEDYDEEDESEDTTHTSIVDSNGMAVSATNTLSQFWGSKVYVAGFFMGNNLRNFSNGVNSYAAGKRPRTFTSPTILINDDGYVLAIGSPGGNVIPNVIVTVLSDIILYGTDPQEAVNKQRVVVRSYDTLMIETSLDYGSLVETSGFGYYLVKNSSARKFGSVNIAGYDPDSGYFATTDPRRLGYGYAVNGE